MRKEGGVEVVGGRMERAGMTGEETEVGWMKIESRRRGKEEEKRERERR